MGYVKLLVDEGEFFLSKINADQNYKEFLCIIFKEVRSIIREFLNKICQRFVLKSVKPTPPKSCTFSLLRKEKKRKEKKRKGKEREGKERKKERKKEGKVFTEKNKEKKKKKKKERKKKKKKKKKKS